MGLLLSVLVVCVGVLEAISCVRHVQHGYLPFWATSRMRPMLHERPRRKSNDDSSDDETAAELTRILHNGGGVNINRAESPSYGLTPILTEHRRNTPILRDSEEGEEPKYVANNIDEPSYCRDGLTERFRPISPPELDGPVDESYVSQTGKFLEVPDGDSPLQRSSSEETLHDSETGDVRSPLDEVLCPVVEHHDVATDGVVFQIDTASPLPVVGSEQIEEDLEIDADDINDDSDLMNDPVYNLVSAAAYILSTDPYPSRTDPHGTTSSTRPLNLNVTARIPTPQSHRESIPFDLAAAHAYTSTSSRPETPTTPRKSRADISWPVFHPEPVIKRPIIAHSELSRDVSIEEDDDVFLEPSLPHSSEPEVLQPQVTAVEEHCSKVVVKSLSDVPATPCMVIPGCRRIGSHRSEDSSPPPPLCKTSFDRFGRITCTPHKGRFARKRRGSLERPDIEGTLKDNVMSKSLPDFFFEEKAKSEAASKMAADDAKMAADDAKMAVDEESVSLGKDITPKESSIKRRRSYREKKRSTWTPNKSRGVESVVTEPLSESETEEVKPKKSLFEIDNESLNEFIGEPSDPPLSKVGSQTEAIVNSVLTPVEVLHHAEVQPESAVYATSRQQPKTRLKEPIKGESFEEAPHDIIASHLIQIIPTEEANSKPLVETEAPPTAVETSSKALVETEAPPSLLEVDPKAVDETQAPPSVLEAKSKALVETEAPPSLLEVDPKALVETQAPPSALETKTKPLVETEAPPPKSLVETQAPPTAVEAKAKTLVETETPPPTPISSDATIPLRDAASKPDETKANDDDEDEEEEEEEEEEDDVSASVTDTSNINQPQQSSQPAPFWVRRE